VLRGGRMVYRDDLPEPVPGPGQVLVAVKACGPVRLRLRAGRVRDLAALDRRR
jgi:NADPH:quinone reductase-like Zn-dependent oxidoreductase